MISLPDVDFYRRMAAGHKIRKGHALVAMLSEPVGGIRQLVRTCC